MWFFFSEPSAASSYNIDRAGIEDGMSLSYLVCNLHRNVSKMLWQEAVASVKGELERKTSDIAI